MRSGGGGARLPPASRGAVISDAPESCGGGRLPVVLSPATKRWMDSFLVTPGSDFAKHESTPLFFLDPFCELPEAGDDGLPAEFVPGLLSRCPCALSSLHVRGCAAAGGDSGGLLRRVASSACVVRVCGGAGRGALTSSALARCLAFVLCGDLLLLGTVVRCAPHHG
ncbi:hypothetical protein E2562_018181 [Oryza meyeriana var. granulata]|uniref:Uncharacterized protein n=1 Tax=Oryza meyeriana var. granulata TaxID=110450 RepID=A0A6G1C8E5_9ORYZ|nr:hypothetical protein E2562_018181 [Oryza meyeriana var. granulata]